MDTYLVTILEHLNGTTALLVLLLLSLVEITPIKIKPVSAIMRWLGSKILGDLPETLNKIIDTVDDNEIDRIRWEIRNFANSCRNGTKHTEDEFDHIIDLNTKYHDILKRRNLTNGKIDLEYNYIINIYRECQKKNSFL